MKCLVIDDDGFSRGFVAAMLNEVADCDQAASGSEAVEKFSTALDGGDPYDLLLLDIMMPDMNGHETAKAIRAIEKKQHLDFGKRVNIIMLTALNTPQSAMESFCSAQSAAYLVKPVSKDNLISVISKLGLAKKK
jgi:two-component system, chemotaxis family, chemotaxis protein CheY